MNHQHISADYRKALKEKEELLIEASPFPVEELRGSSSAGFIYLGLGLRANSRQLEKIRDCDWDTKSELIGGISYEMTPLSLGAMGYSMDYLFRTNTGSEEQFIEAVKSLGERNSKRSSGLLEECSEERAYRSFPFQQRSGFQDYVISHMSGRNAMPHPFIHPVEGARGLGIGYNEFLFYMLTQGPLGIKILGDGERRANSVPMNPMYKKINSQSLDPSKIKILGEERYGVDYTTLCTINEKIIPPALDYVKSGKIFPDMSFRTPREQEYTENRNLKR